MALASHLISVLGRADAISGGFRCNWSIASFGNHMVDNLIKHAERVTEYLVDAGGLMLEAQTTPAPVTPGFKD